MFKKFSGKLSNARKQLRVLTQHTPKLFTSATLTLVVTVGVLGSGLVPASTNAAALRESDSNAVVTCAYTSILNRAPDAAGKSYWINRYTTSGYNANRLAAQMIATPEGRSKAYITPFGDFVKLTYRNCLRREAKSTEITEWEKATFRGTSRANVFAMIVKTGDRPEFQMTACKRYDRGGLMPLCAYGSAGTTQNVKIQTVAGSNIRVNAAWTTSVANLRAEAGRHGYSLQAFASPANQLPNCIGNKTTFNNSYRSWNDQNCLYRSPGYDANPPGRSMHEWGLAIDFNCNGSQSITKNTACWNWVRRNAPRYGVYNFHSVRAINSSEAWHFSSNGL